MTELRSMASRCYEEIFIYGVEGCVRSLTSQTEMRENTCPYPYRSVGAAAVDPAKRTAAPAAASDLHLR